MKSHVQIFLSVLSLVPLAHGVELGGQNYGTDTTLAGSNTWANGGVLVIQSGVTLTLPTGAYVNYSRANRSLLSRTPGQQDCYAR